MIKAIIFDFYGVVCSEIGSPWYKRLSSQETISDLKEKYDIPSNLGKISEKEFFAGISKAIGSNGETVRGEWINSAVINKDLINLITDLKTKYKVALCSNTQPKLFRDLLRENDMEKLFDIIVSSSEIGIMKPNPEIFEHTLNELEMIPDEVIFIDDRSENVEGAESVGIKSFVYFNNDQLKKELGNIL